MTTIYFVRHGTFVNPQHRIPYRLEGFPLSQEGKQEILSLSQLLKDKDIKAIYTSPILRTKETADIIGSTLGIKPRISPLIIEVNSPYAGFSELWMQEQVPDIYNDEHHLAKGGETIEDIYLRMKKMISQLLITHQNESVIAVSHADPIMICVEEEMGFILKSAQDIERLIPYIPMGKMLKLEYDDTKLERVKRFY